VIACASECTAPHASVLANLQSEAGLPCQRHNCMIYLHPFANILLRTRTFSYGINLLTRYDIAYIPVGCPGQALAASRCTHGPFTVTSISSALWAGLRTVSTPTICLKVVHYLSSKHKYESGPLNRSWPYVPVACCTLPIVLIIINVHRTEAVNKGGMAICQHEVLDCLNTIFIGGWS